MKRYRVTMKDGTVHTIYAESPQDAKLRIIEAKVPLNPVGGKQEPRHQVKKVEKEGIE